MTALDRAGPARLLERPGLARVLAALAVPGEETRIVGGAVRDALLGRPVSDMDLATTLLPEAVSERARAAGLKAVPTGIEHGTITLVADGAPYEVTTLREDIETDGRHAVVRFGRDFAADAARRDFTINALSLSPDGALHDLTGGIEDLAGRRVRFIGDPATRIREDHLRILRFFRFHARYGEGTPDPEGMAAAIAAREGLDRLSRERVRGEMLRLLVAPRAEASLRAMAEAGLLLRLLGGLADLGRFGRVTAAEEGLDTPDAVRRLAALAVFVPEDAERLRDGLRLSKAETSRLTDYGSASVFLHAQNRLDLAQVRRVAATHGKVALIDAATALLGEPTPLIDEKAQGWLTALRDGKAAEPALPLTGADLVAAGAPPGPALGRALAAARAQWLARGCPEGDATRDALLAIALRAVRDRQP